MKYTELKVALRRVYSSFPSDTGHHQRKEYYDIISRCNYSRLFGLMIPRNDKVAGLDDAGLR